MTGNGRKRVDEDYMPLHTASDKKQHGVAFTVTPKSCDKS